MSPLAITFICIAGILLLLFIAYFCTKSKKNRNYREENYRREEHHRGEGY